MRKIFIVLLMLGFLSSYSFAAEQATVAAPDTTKAAETKPVKKAKKKKMKADKKAKKAAKAAETKAADTKAGETKAVNQ